MSESNVWAGTLTRAQAIKIFDQATDGNDAFWDELMDEYYDEDADSWPTVFQLFDALGVGREEYEQARNTAHDKGSDE